MYYCITDNTIYNLNKNIVSHTCKTYVKMYIIYKKCRILKVLLTITRIMIYNPTKQEV
ncbi:hypothetical protein HMPREF1548_05312 [Clostridium sp. KLE 1755]|nr:hypothetical protein HMPREF1548_05312 [Clostridium sp. KLE 1755]